MPDDQDYAALGALLGRAEVWTTAEADRVMWIRNEQAAMLAAVHSKDQKGRRRLQEVLDEVDRAIAVWQDGQS